MSTPRPSQEDLLQAALEELLAALERQYRKVDSCCSGHRPAVYLNYSLSVQNAMENARRILPEKPIREEDRATIGARQQAKKED